MIYLVSEADLAVREQDDALVVGGYAFRWEQTASVGGLFRERFERNSVPAKAIRDVGLNVGHRAPFVVRTTSGDLTVAPDDKGLAWEATLDRDDPEAVSLYRRAKRRVFGGVSVGFIPERGGMKRSFDGGKELVTITKVAQIREISVVNHPVYQSSSIEARSAEEFYRSLPEPARPGPYRSEARTQALRAVAASRR